MDGNCFEHTCGLLYKGIWTNFFNSTNISQKLWHFSEEFLKAHCEFGIKQFHIFASNLWLIKFRFLAPSPLLWTFYKMTKEKIMEFKNLYLLNMEVLQTTRQPQVVF